MPVKNRFRTTNILLEASTYVAIVGIFIGLGLNLERTAQFKIQEEQRAALFRTKSVISERIQEAINNKHLFARGLAGAISLRPDISEQEFSRLCAAIKVEDPSVVNMALVKNMMVTHVYPIEENQEFIGRDLSAMPAQAIVLSEIERTGKTALSGPTILFQGYPGYILREPVFLASDEADAGEFFAVASVVFSAELFLEEIRLSDFTDNYDIAVQAQNLLGDVAMVYGNEDAFARDRDAQQLTLPNSIWTLSVSPTLSSISHPEGRGFIHFWIALAALGSLATAWYLHRLRRENWRNATRLRAAVNVLPSGFVMFDRDDKLQLCNDGYRSIHGEGAITKGATFASILHTGLKAGLYADAVGNEKAWLKRHLARGDDKGTEFTIELSNGHWLQVLEQETPDGGRVAVLNDITEPLMSRKRAKLAEQRLRDAIDALPVGFWLFDKDDSLLMFNTVSGGKLPGQRREISSGRMLRELVERRVSIASELRIAGVPTTDAEVVFEALSNETSELEVRYEGDIWFKYFSRRTSEGGLVMFRVEISDLRNHQQRLEASNTELRAALDERDEAENRFLAVADTSSEWFWEQDADLRLTYLSEGFMRTMGLDSERFIGRLRDDIMVPEDKGSDAEPLKMLYEKMRSREPFHDVVYCFKFHPEKESWIRTSGKPVFASDGTFRGYIGTAEDVTRFYTALRQAEQADEAKTQFLNVISHELRTPLTAVIGFNSFIANSTKLPSHTALIQALETGVPDDIRQSLNIYQSEIGGFSERIRCAGTQLQSLIDDMLDLARIEANTMRIDPVRVDSLRVVQSVVDQIQTLAAEKSVKLKIDITDMPVLADDMRFRQILTNVFGNALKFTDHGSISIQSARKGDMVVFRVTDTGIGIEPDRLSIIFDRFAQVDVSTTRKNPGVGLGLAICKDLARLQGGWIKAESTYGKGTVMIFALPAWKDT